MEISHLREFIVFSKYLNLTKAAAHLFLSQTVLMRHIAALEQDLNVQLVKHINRKLLLTDAGKLLLDEAHTLLERHTHVLQKIHQHRSGEVGIIRIAYLEAASKHFLIPFLTHFNHVYPNIQIHLYSYEYLPLLTTALQRNTVDVIFTLSLAMPIAGFNWKPVCCDFTSAVVPCNHPLANESTIDTLNLADQPFLLLSSNNNPQGFQHSIQLCKVRGFMPHIAQQLPNIKSVLLMMELNKGITFLPNHTRMYANPSVRYVDLYGIDCRFDIGLAWKKGNSNPSLKPLLNEFEKTYQTFIHPSYHIH
ncbi:MAG: transcriptional regulator AlsR family [Firmicutes bacterium]|nr:transcriptional regulator AlsR family [Bacillota bacterium]